MKFSIITLALAVSALAMPHGDHSHSHDGEHDHDHDHEVIKPVQQDIKQPILGSVKPLQELNKDVGDVLISQYLKGETEGIPADALAAALALGMIDHGHPVLDSGKGKNDTNVTTMAVSNVGNNTNTPTSSSSVVVKPALANVLPTNITMNGTATNGNSTTYGNSTAPGVSTPAPKENGAIVNNAAFGVVFGGVVAAVVVGGL